MLLWSCGTTESRGPTDAVRSARDNVLYYQARIPTEHWEILILEETCAEEFLLPGYHGNLVLLVFYKTLI